MQSHDAANLAAALAQLKCRTVAAGLDDPEALVIGCDSVLAFENGILGKPDDARDAAMRWRRMRGKSGILHTGHCVRLGGREFVETASTVVHFADITDAEIDAYVATGEPLRVAGAFTIDGLGGRVHPRDRRRSAQCRRHQRAAAARARRRPGDRLDRPLGASLGLVDGGKAEHV